MSSAHVRTLPVRRSQVFVPPPEEEPIGVVMGEGLYISEEQLHRIDKNPSKARQLVRAMLADSKTPKIIRGPTERPEGVRIAGPSDEQAIYDLAIIDLNENAVTVAPINEEKVRDIVHRATNRLDGMIVGVIDGPDKKPVAFQVLAPEEWWWSKAKYLCKLVDFVHPDHRKSDYALRLIQFAKWASDFFTERTGYQMYLLSGVLATKKVKGKVRLYSRNVTPVGAYFLYPHPPGMDEPFQPLGPNP